MSGNNNDPMIIEPTPGPWMIFEGGDIGSASVRSPSTTVLNAGSVKGATIGTAMMNSRLIAAAPELLKWLKEILADVDAGNNETPETSRWQEAHAVIAETDIPKWLKKL
jgi:hypothetical protein